jgi:ABC-2 type transport system ATP-binding protein
MPFQGYWIGCTEPGPERVGIVPPGLLSAGSAAHTLVPTMELAIQTSGLSRCFGDVVAVDGLDLRVERGTFYGFLGPNGAGKSTTIKMLTGLLAPTGGVMRILDQDLSDREAAREIKRRVGVVPEQLGLFDNLTGREYLTFVGRMYRLPAPTVRERCRELLAMMGLADEEKKLTLEYSHGMKKKLALAAALIANPDVLFLDEPFEGVDAVSSRVLRDMLGRCVQRGATVFLTSHVLEIVEKLCTAVGIIANGRLVYQGTMDEVRQSGSLEDRFIEAVGLGQVERQTLSWLEG